MLISLHVRNFALIDDLELQFGSGLNILTGETGAGKSIIIDALGAALGERVSSDLVRSGSDKLVVEALFSLKDAPPATRAKLEHNGLLDADDADSLVFTRELTKTGKSQSRVNGHLVPVSMLRSVGQDLVDVHGQHEHQSLLAAESHIDLLDNWLGDETLALKTKMSDLSSQLTAAKKELGTLVSDERERARNVDLFRFQYNEIVDSDLRPNELEELNAERLKLANSERLSVMADDVYGSLGTTAADAIGSALSSLTKVSDLDPALSPIIEQVEEASAYLEEAVGLLRRYKDNLDAEPGRLEFVNERLNLIRTLQRKYGDSIAEILEYAKTLERKLNSLEDVEAHKDSLMKRLSALEEAAEFNASKLSRLRHEGGKQFSSAIVTELQDLNMARTVFETSISGQPITSKGADRVEFMISTNPGEPLRPLAKAASGGETSRLMLAIKSVLSKSSFIPTMIFDEIDTGIGGRTGRILAEKLANLSQIAQVLCITHLPQIASRPVSTHFSIEKAVSDGRTIVVVSSLSAYEREAEIARMLGGDGSDTVLQHAREMLSAK